MKIVFPKIHVLLAALVIAVLAPAEVSARSIHSEFSEAWADRDGRYLQERDAADMNARQKAAALFEVLQSSASNVEPQLIEMRDAIDAVAYLDGRGAILRDLRIRMNRKPSAAATELWMQEQVNQMQADAKRADALLAEAQKPHPEWNIKQQLSAFEAAITAAAQARGKVDELVLIDQNLASYYQAKRSEDVQRQNSRRAFLGALGMALRQSAMQTPAQPAFWSARCTTWQNQTNCTGR